MSSSDNPSRVLPARPDVRFLKDEAKRRLADGEFQSLSAAQFAIAREHGFSGWPKLKQFIETRNLAVAERAAALVTAACSNDIRKARMLLATEPDLARFNFFTACACGETEFVEKTLARDPSLATKKGGSLDREPILYACFSRFLRADAARAAGIVKIVRLLLERGADPNSFYVMKDGGYEWGHHCIYAAAGIANNAELTRMLFDFGAKMDDPAIPPDSTLHPASEAVYHAAEFSDPTCLKMVLDHKPPKRSVDYCLARATDFENLEVVETFLKAGSDPNYRVNWRGERTQTHKAVIAGRGEAIIRALLDHGGDVNAIDAFGVSMLRSAVREAHDAVAKLLIERGADSSGVTEDDRAMGALANGRPTEKKPAMIDPHAVLLAAQRDDVAALTALLDAGASPDGPGHPHLMPPLHNACWHGCLAAAELLLERGADPMRRNPYGGTALSTTIHGSANCFSEGGPSMRLPEEIPGRQYAEIIELLIARGSPLPEKITEAGDGVRAVLVRHGVPEE